MLRKTRPTDELDERSPGDGVADTDQLVHDDDVFALLLTCCHPALSTEARVALTLRHVCGLTSAEIAAAFLVEEPTMAKRLVRARRRILDTGIRFDPPTDDRLTERVDDVRSVIYLLFTEGHLSAGEGPAIRAELCDEAIWLARQLHQLRPDDDETLGLLALLLLQNSRRSSRWDDAGVLVPFAEQDRSEWDASAVAEARDLLAGSARSTLGPFQVEAAIALLHASGDDPDWARIADLYALLARLAPSPIVEVNRALAVGRADGPLAGLQLIEASIVDERLTAYAPAHAVHADLLEAVDRNEDALTAWRRAADATAQPEQRASIDRRIARLTDLA